MYSVSPLFIYLYILILRTVFTSSTLHLLAYYTDQSLTRDKYCKHILLMEPWITIKT